MWLLDMFCVQLFEFENFVCKYPQMKNNLIPCGRLRIENEKMKESLGDTQIPKLRKQNKIKQIST